MIRCLSMSKHPSHIHEFISLKQPHRGSAFVRNEATFSFVTRFYCHAENVACCLACFPFLVRMVKIYKRPKPRFSTFFLSPPPLIQLSRNLRSAIFAAPPLPSFLPLYFRNRAFPFSWTHLSRDIRQCRVITVIIINIERTRRRTGTKTSVGWNILVFNQ